MNPKVFVTRRIAASALERIADVCDLELWEDELPPPPGTLLDRVQGVDGLLCMITDRIDSALLDAGLPQLKVVSNMAVGYNNIDIAAARARGIVVGNTPGVLTDATADLTMALLLTMSRRIVEGVEYVRAGEWRTWHPEQLLGRDLSRMTLGILGLGRIGRAVARRAFGFGMRIIAYSPSLTPETAIEAGAKAVSFEELLMQSDVLTLHVPLTPKTHRLINADTLALMKPSALLINTARGGVVDQAALYNALASGVIAGAALDVTDPEPIIEDDPLLTLSNVIILPHIGSATIHTREQMALIAAENVIRGVMGQPLLHSVG